VVTVVVDAVVVVVVLIGVVVVAVVMKRMVNRDCKLIKVHKHARHCQIDPKLFTDRRTKPLYTSYLNTCNVSRTHPENNRDSTRHVLNPATYPENPRDSTTHVLRPVTRLVTSHCITLISDENLTPKF
jgi:hypothetical protein